MKKSIILLLTIAVMLSTLTFTASSEGDFKMKEFDKAYITFVFDDGNMPFTEQCYNLFKKHNLPVCFSIIANKVNNDPQLISILKDTEKMGGEVLSHTYSHSAFNEFSGKEDFEYQLGKSFVHLRALGFNVNGVIEAGNGGNEAKANYELMETVTRKYYKYSNAYGVSPQYKKKRTWLSYANDKYAFAKATIDDAIAKKEWVVFSAHSFNEAPYEDLNKILTYIKEKGTQQVEVVNWNYIYTNFGEYKGPAVPTSAALASVEKHKKELAEKAAQSSKPSSSKDSGKEESSKASAPSSNTSSTNSTANNTSVNINNSTTNNITSNNVTNNNTTNNNTTNNITNNSTNDTTTIGATNNSNSYQNTTEKGSGTMLWVALGIVAFTLILGAVILIFALKYKTK